MISFLKQQTVELKWNFFSIDIFPFHIFDQYLFFLHAGIYSTDFITVENSDILKFYYKNYTDQNISKNIFLDIVYIILYGW